MSPPPVSSAPPPVFPHIFVESGLNDTRVRVAEPVTWVAHLRAAWGPSAAAGRLLTHLCDLHGGHTDGGEDETDEAARSAQLVLSVLGVPL